MSDMSATDEREEYTGAFRLVFEYEGEDVRLISQSRIEKALPPGDPSAGRSGFQGTWSELRDSSGATLDRRVLVNALPPDMEVFPEQLGEEIRREPLERRAGVFTLLVPELSGADHVAVLSNAPAEAGDGAATGPVELIRVDLTAGQREEP
jgi:hypothetical protein